MTIIIAISIVDTFSTSNLSIIQKILFKLKLHTILFFIYLIDKMNFFRSIKLNLIILRICIREIACLGKINRLSIRITTNKFF